ncbi:unnamed protein product [Cuscuta campestris]|uniref:Retrotransposon Copia-like N-terminal domain-containing protein n=1 Tax=Cuscuta campestris TaxID=132261 RepID=A0A484M4H8_9ASTE|nr:unnamed protein product [Cuscuta campestris]
MAENSEITSQTTPSTTPHLALTTISNVKLHVPVQLSLSQPNYKKWSSLFLLLVRRFKLQGYLDGSFVPLSDDDDEWCQLDALLQGWILSTINDEVSDLVISSLTTASALWKVIHDLFHDNKHARAMQLEHEFRTTVKGSTSMAAYCQRLQNLADWLDDVDAPVSQHQLVLQMLRGLPADLQGQTSFMQFQCRIFFRFARLSCSWIVSGQTLLTPAARPCSPPEPAGQTAAAAPVDSTAAAATVKATRDSAAALDEGKDVAADIGVVDVDVKTAPGNDKPMTAIPPGTHLTQTLTLAS